MNDLVLLTNGNLILLKPIHRSLIGNNMTGSNYWGHKNSMTLPIHHFPFIFYLLSPLNSCLWKINLILDFSKNINRTHGTGNLYYSKLKTYRCVDHEETWQVVGCIIISNLIKYIWSLLYNSTKFRGMKLKKIWRKWNIFKFIIKRFLKGKLSILTSNWFSVDLNSTVTL